MPVPREKLDVLKVCQRYRIRVIRAVQRNGYVLLETNRGPKELRVWPRLDLLRWSHAWREQMARQGWRDVERFIRTRDAKPYVVWGNAGCTLTDHLREAEPLPVTSDALRRCGQAVARMHLAQRSHHLPFAMEVWNRHVLQAEAEAERVRSLCERLGKSGPEGGERNWLVRQLPPLLERMERSVQMLSLGAPSADDVAVSHGVLGRDNWRVLGDRLILSGFYRAGLAVQQRDTASFLREVFAESDGVRAGLEAVDAFLDGYEEWRPLRRGEYALLLAFLTYPGELWKRMEQALTEPTPPAEETMHQLKRLVRTQQRMDALLTHIAHRADRTAKG